jgi:alpha-L-rhamnosidase
MKRRQFLSGLGVLGGALQVSKLCPQADLLYAESSLAKDDNGDFCPTHLRCEYRANPIGIDTERPRFSWIVGSESPRRRSKRQTAYQILVARSAQNLAAGIGDLWHTNRIESDQSIQIVYAGFPTVSRQRCHWKVRIWDERGAPSAWSQPALWTVGLRKPTDWKGKWIGAGAVSADKSVSDPSAINLPLMRQQFRLEGRPLEATAHVASCGYHELYVNGSKVSDSVLSPAVSQFDKRILYSSYDVTKFVRKGANCAGLWLGIGWFRPGGEGVFQHGPAVMAELDIRLENGMRVFIGTDETWKAQVSPITIVFPSGKPPHKGICGEEHYDATREISGWSNPGLNDTTWRPVKRLSLPQVSVAAQVSEPNRITAVLKPKSIEKVSSNSYLIDMGRNYSGFFSLRFKATASKAVRMEYMEKEIGIGESGAQPVASNVPGFGPHKALTWWQHDQYQPKGEGEETFSNRFDYRSFRWVRVTGLEKPPAIDDVRGYLVRTDSSRAGEFHCSNELLNQIYETAVWTDQCLSLGSYSVDCPHRERMGYGAEGQATMETAMTTHDVAAFYTHWTTVWRDVQNVHSGAMPSTAPGSNDGGGPGWGGICVTLPWQLYLRYGDKRILEDSYGTIVHWLDFLATNTRNGVLVHYGDPDWGFLADWLEPGRQLRTRWTNAVDLRSDEFFNNCFYLYILGIASKIASVVGQYPDAAKFDGAALELRGKLHRQYYNPQSATYANGEQACLAFALFSGVVPAELYTKVMNRLEEDIVVKNRGHLNTGVLGTYFLIKLLLREHRNDLILRMTSQQDFPGWGYILAMGATTFGEQWGGLHSQVHSSFLSIGSWFIEGLGGIQCDERAPGFKHFFIRPSFAGDLKFVRARYRSISGEIATEWEAENSAIHLRITVPSNTTATAFLPGNNPSLITESGRPLGDAEGVQVTNVGRQSITCRLGSGDYSFLCALKPKI